MFTGGGRGGLVVALRNREWGFGEGGADHRQGGDISRVSGPWRGGGSWWTWWEEREGASWLLGFLFSFSFFLFAEGS